MDDMNAFEKQVAREASLEAGPSRPVEVASIVHSTTNAAPVGRWSPVTRLYRGGRTPAPGEGGISMLSAVKIVAATAIVALFGGFLLVGVVGDPQDSEPLPPAAESPSAEDKVELPAEFSGAFGCTTYWDDGTTENVVVGPVEGGNLVRRETRGGLGRFEAEMSDPRLQGDWNAYTATDEYFWPGVDSNLPLIMEPGVLRVTNDQGSWQTPWSYFALPGEMSTGGNHGVGYLVGEEGYDGLTAMFRVTSGNWDDCHCFVAGGLTRTSMPCVWEIEGLIIEGVAPEVDIPE